MKRAVFFELLRGKKVKCTLCPRNCVIPNGGIGYCRTRMNQNGVLYSLVYGSPLGFQIDPIEKKPFYHFHPNSRVLSFGTIGCNFNCDYCINYFQSQSSSIVNVKIDPLGVVNKALINKCDGIAFTYNEPTIFFEYALDVMKIAHQHGLFNVMVTNGCINKDPVLSADGLLDAVVINFKGFNADFYKRYINARLSWVKNGVRYYSRINAHKEVTNLVVPGLNDSLDEVRALSRFIIDTLGPDTPFHLLRFYPSYKLNDIPETPLSVLEECAKVARDEGLKYVYLGNVGESNSYCPYCGNLLIKRVNNKVSIVGLNGNVCSKCGSRLPFFGVSSG